MRLRYKFDSSGINFVAENDDKKQPFKLEKKGNDFKSILCEIIEKIDEYAKSVAQITINEGNFFHDKYKRVAKLLEECRNNIKCLSWSIMHDSEGYSLIDVNIFSEAITMYMFGNNNKNENFIDFVTNRFILKNRDFENVIGIMRETEYFETVYMSFKIIELLNILENKTDTQMITEYQQEYLQKPLFDIIDKYFLTFDNLCISLMELVLNYNTKNEIYSNTLKSNALLFEISPGMIKRRIAEDVNNKKGDIDIIKKYITNKYDTIKSRIVGFGCNFHGYKEYEFAILKSYVENAIPAKQLFFCDTDFFGTKENPKQPTIGDYYDKIIQELETGYNAIMNLFSDSSTFKNTDVETSSQKPLHFTRSFTDTERLNLFNGLVNGGFIPKDTNHDNFNFVFGGTETDNFEPLKWTATVGLLAYFIDSICVKTDKTNLWEITKKCFTIKGKAPNTDSLKNTVSKYKNDNTNKPNGHDKIDEILNRL